jgi:hypothetical protein
MGEVDIPNTGTFSGIKNAVIDRYKRDTAGSPEFLLANKQITQEEYDKIIARKPSAAVAATPSSDPNANLPPMPANVKVDDKGRADAAKQGSDTSAGIKAAAPSTGVGIKPNTGIAPNIGGIKFPTAPVPETQAELDKGAAERVAAYGVNEGIQKDRARLMGEKANTAEENRRATALRMAEFFGAWGSTPGNTIVAGLNALKNKMPDFISDIKDEAKIRRQIDKDIAELDKLDREEKNGIKKDYFAERAKLADRAMHMYGYQLTAYSAAQQTAAYREVGSARASGEGGVAKNLNQATMRYQTEDKNIAAEKKGDGEYKLAVAKLATKPDDPTALAIKTKKEAAWNDRLAALKEDVDYYKKKQGRETKVDEPASGAKAAPGTAGNPIKL